MRTLLAACILLAAPLALADHAERCERGGDLALGLVVIPVAGETLYIDDAGAASGNSVTVYRESNGIEGLQRGGASPILPDDAETCVEPGPWSPDERVV